MNVLHGEMKAEENHLSFYVSLCNVNNNVITLLLLGRCISFMYSSKSEKKNNSSKCNCIISRKREFVSHWSRIIFIFFGWMFEEVLWTITWNYLDTIRITKDNLHSSEIRRVFFLQRRKKTKWM